MLPIKGREKSQIAEDRKQRQFQTYGSRPSRDDASGSSRAARDRWNRREKGKPIADFQLAYKELSDLLSDKTNCTYQNRMKEEGGNPGSSMNNHYRGCRFVGYKSTRSEVPTFEEFAAFRFRALVELEGQSLAEKEEQEGEEKLEEALEEET